MAPDARPVWARWRVRSLAVLAGMPQPSDLRLTAAGRRLAQGRGPVTDLLRGLRPLPDVPQVWVLERPGLDRAAQCRARQAPPQDTPRANARAAGIRLVDPALAPDQGYPRLMPDCRAAVDRLPELTAPMRPVRV